MTEVRDKRSLFPNSSSALGSGEKRRRPPPPPTKNAPPASPSAPSSSSHNHHLRNGKSLSPPSIRNSGSDKINKLSPALLNRIEKTNSGSLGGGGVGGIKGEITGAKTPSHALKKKTISASKLQPKPPTGGRPAKESLHQSSELQANRLGVGLLASVTRNFSASTGNLDSMSSSSSSSSSHRQTSPPSVRVKSSSPQIATTRKTAALSMDVSSKLKPGVKEKPARPVSSGVQHRVNPRVNTPVKIDISPFPFRAVSTSGIPSFPRGRQDFADSFEESYSPPQRSSPAPQSPTNNTLTVRQPFAAGISRSTENLLGDERRRKSPGPNKVTKQRSSSDATSPPPPPHTKRGPKPAPPPKKPGLKSAVSLTAKPAPPPKKPHLKHLKKSPEFSRRVSAEGGRSPTSPRGPPPPVPERVCSPSGTPNTNSSSTTVRLRPFSPSSNTTTPLPHQPVPSTNRGGVGEVITSGASPFPFTPSPRTSQLEAMQRNADSGFVSEAAEDPASPLETAAAVTMATEVWDEARVEKARNKRLHIAEELLHTEVTYVERLHFIAVRFHGAVTTFNSQNKNVIPEGDINRIFLNISQIHNLNTNILEELQKRMDTWKTREGFGDVIERLAPFLKLYAHYTSGFEDAMKLLTSWTKRDKKFDALVRDFEQELATGLGVAHYMLEPVQRIPRYRLLLTDYLKYIPPDSPDRQPTQKALEIISEAADHSNDRIKDLENSNTILSIQRSLQDFEGTLLAPSRLFIRKGQLQKFSRKTTTPRMFFLFSDMLLHTEPAGTDVYKFKNEMPIFMMKVEEPIVSLVPYDFNVESTTRSLILVASSEAEKKEWMMALRKAISEERKKRASLRRDLSIKVDLGVLGAQAPIMVPDKSVTMCQACSALFTFTFRRHHCRGCGKVVCGNCSQWKTFLHYLKKSERVCEKCYYTAKSESGEEVIVAASSPKTSRRKEGLGGGILDLKGYEEDTIKGGYVLSQDGRKWNRLWYQLKQDFCLYKFRAHEDIKAISALPLPGYIVEPDPETHTITLTHPSYNKKLSDTFKPENTDDFDYWVLALESVVQLEMPSLPPDSKISPPPFDERLRSQSLRNLDAVNLPPEESPLENSI